MESARYIFLLNLKQLSRQARAIIYRAIFCVNLEQFVHEPSTSSL